MKPLNEIFKYDPETGILRRKVYYKWKEVRGDEKDYIRIFVSGKMYLGHRLAWYLVYGTWPKEIDHVNGVKSDNRLTNLRDVAHSENIRNTVRLRRQKYLKGV